MDKCEICGSTDEVYGDTCDSCWYGMRMCPDSWMDDLASKGIEVKRTGFGEMEYDDDGKLMFHVEGNPYERDEPCT